MKTDTWPPLLLFNLGGRCRSVGIATHYELKGPRIETQWGGDISAPVQTGPDAHPAACKMGTGYFRG